MKRILILAVLTLASCAFIEAIWISKKTQGRLVKGEKPVATVTDEIAADWKALKVMGWPWWTSFALLTSGIFTTGAVLGRQAMKKKLGV